MTNTRDKKLIASFFMVLMIASPLTVMADDTFCTKTWSNIYFNDYMAGALQCNGSFVSWGVNQFGGLGYGYAGQIQSTPVQVYADYANWIQIALNLYYTIGLGLDHSVYGWGSNSRGNLDSIVPLGGIKLTADAASNITSLGKCKYVATHGLQYTTYAIRDNGRLLGLGDNSHSQLGVASSSLALSSTPRQIGSASNWVAVYPAKRDSHVCAINSAGNLYCWGENYQYQVGDGTMTDRASPYLIGSASDSWLSVHPQLSFTIALKSDGTLWGMGTTFYGVFGTGTDYAQFTVPTLLAGGKTFREVAVHDNYVIAIDTAGKLWGWGDNMYTQVNSNAGVGIQNIPHKIDNGNNWKHVFVSVGIQMNAIGSAFAIKNTNELFAWGSNDNGQLGLGTDAVVSVPTKVMNNVAKVVSVGYVTGIITLSEDIYTTGFNNMDLLGDGTILPSNEFHSCADRNQKCIANVCYNTLLRQ